MIGGSKSQVDEPREDQPREGSKPIPETGEEVWRLIESGDFRPELLDRLAKLLGQYADSKKSAE